MENRIFLVAIVLILLGVGVVLFQPTVEEKLAPKVESAWVAIEVAGDGSPAVAKVGPVELDLDTPFQLRAVVGARDRDGEMVYYTEAKALRIGGQEIPADRLRVWDRRKKIKIRWYTVEGRWPFLPLRGDAGISTFQMQTFLRSDWPLAWSVPGAIDAANDDHIESESALERQRFGTQRYHVRFEVYQNEDDLVPEEVVRSWAVDELRDKFESFPMVVRTDRGPAAPAMRVFGLTHLQPSEGSPDELLGQIAELSQNRLAFSRTTVMRDLLASAGLAYSDLSWTSVDLEGEVNWTDDVAAGDLLRVGDRVVVLYRDAGSPDVLDYGDLCFDFVQGAEVRELSGVFSGEGEAVEHASLQGGSKP